MRLGDKFKQKYLNATNSIINEFNDLSWLFKAISEKVDSYSISSDEEFIDSKYIFTIDVSEIIFENNPKICKLIDSNKSFKTNLIKRIKSWINENYKNDNINYYFSESSFIITIKYLE